MNRTTIYKSLLKFPLIFNNVIYKNTQNLKQKIKQTLAKYDYNSEIVDQKDILFFKSILHFHFINVAYPNFSIKSIHKYFVHSITIQEKKYRCLAIQFSDSLIIKKISIQNFFHYPTAWKEFSQTCRNAISYQCMEFANKFKERNQLSNLKEFHVDHHEPQFIELVLIFFKNHPNIKQKFIDGELIYEREPILQFKDKRIELKFQNFHEKNAKLKMMTSFDNVRRPKIYVPDWCKNAKPSYKLSNYDNYKTLNENKFIHVQLIN